MFTEDGLGVARSWLIQGELMLDVIQGMTMVEHSISSSDIHDLKKNLEDSANFMGQRDCFILQTRCILLLAILDFNLQNFSEAREKIIKCMNISKELELQDIQLKASKYFEKCSLKIQEEVNNMLIFGSSFPIPRSDFEEYKIVPMQQIDISHDILVNALS